MFWSPKRPKNVVFLPERLFVKCYRGVLFVFFLTSVKTFLVFILTLVKTFFNFCTYLSSANLYNSVKRTKIRSKRPKFNNLFYTIQVKIGSLSTPFSSFWLYYLISSFIFNSVNGERFLYSVGSSAPSPM